MQRRVWPVWTYYAIALLVVLIDYASKKIIERTLELDERIPVLGNFFLLTSIRNRGAAFSILQNQRWFFIAITIVVVIAIVGYLHRYCRKGSRLVLVAAALVLGGAVGNFLDRIFKGEVVDFLQFNFGSYTFPIFNLADSGITVGVVLIILDSLLSSKRETQSNDREQTREEQPG